MAIFTSNKRSPLFSLLCLLLCSSTSLAAAPTLAATPAAAALAGAQQWLTQQALASGLRAPQITLQLLPSRQAASGCSGKPLAELVDGTQFSRLRVVVKCQLAGEVSYLIRGDVSGLALAARQDVAPGHMLATDDIDEQRVRLNGAQPLARSADEIVGQRSKTLIRQGMPFRSALLESAPPVKRGMAVEIVAEQEGIRVQVAGVALETGQRGEWVRVKNSKNGTVIRARVMADGVVSPELAATAP